MEEVQNIGIGGRNYNCVAVSPDGTRLICAMDSKIVTTMWTMDPQSGLWGSAKDITVFGTTILFSPLALTRAHSHAHAHFGSTCRLDLFFYGLCLGSYIPLFRYSRRRSCCL